MKCENMIQSFLEFASAIDSAPYLANLCDVLQKADTPFRRSITEREVDNGVDALKDWNHSGISMATGYANDWLREYDKNRISMSAEGIKAEIKDFLRAKGLLAANG